MAAQDYIKPLLEKVLEQLHAPSPVVVAIGAILALVFPVLLHFILSSSTEYIVLPTILLAGPSGSGKTALLTHLERRGNHVSTHLTQLPHSVELSVSAAKASVSGEKKKVKSFREDLDAQGAQASKFLVQDTPGHGKLRGSALQRVDNATQEKIRGVLFVVDSSSLAEPEALADAAGYLYDVLIRLQQRAATTKSGRAPPSIPVLVAANKMDLFTAKPTAQVKACLEIELGRIRSTRSRGLLDSGVGADDLDAGEEEAHNWLGEVGSKKFEFSQLEDFGIDVEVEGGNVEGKGLGVDKWWEWIAEQI